MSAIAGANPFLENGADAKALYVAFLKDAPTAKARAQLDLRRSPPDEFVISGKDIFLYCPNGFGRTKLTTAYFDAALGGISTVRNWRTVVTLSGLAGR